MRSLVLCCFVINSGLCAFGVPQKENDCFTNENCASERVCSSRKCVDPCVGACPSHATCHVSNHVAVCDCVITKHEVSLVYDSPLSLNPEPSPPPRKKVKKYRIETNMKVDFPNALLQCYMEGKRLATVKSKEENDLLLTALNETKITGKQFWLSGTDMVSEGWFIWQSTGEWFQSQRFKYWYTGQPDNYNGNEHCVDMWDADNIGVYKWNDRSCSSKQGYVCEYFEEQ